MTSPERQAANWRNARRSTGPRSAAGKHIAAQNAVRHRLSVPLPPSLLDPLREQVAALLAASGLAAGDAALLAERIIDFERNMAAFREIECALLNGAEEAPQPTAGGWSVSRLALPPGVAAMAETNWRQSGKHLPCAEYQALQSGARYLVRLSATRKHQSTAAFERYLRRARNQLLKALRALD